MRDLATDEPPRIYAVCGDELISGNTEVRRRVSDLPSTRVPVHNHTFESMRTSEELLCRRNVTGSNDVADTSARHACTFGFDNREFVHDQPGITQRLRGSGSTLAESESCADHHDPRTNLANEHLGNEILG